MPLPVIPIKAPYLPELLPEVVGALEALLPDGAVVFEYGSGASTVWFAQRARSVVSVEHEPEWAAETHRALVEAGVERHTVIILVATEDNIAPAIEPYAEFDMVLVDCLDRHRPPAIEGAMSHVKPGGYMVIDDSHWSGLRAGMDILEEAGWLQLTINGWHTRKTGKVRFHQTTIFRRPDNG